MRPQWYGLLKEQRDGKGITKHGQADTFRMGLHVSFVLGAALGHGQRPTIHDLAALLESMAKEDTGSTIRVYECPGLPGPAVNISTDVTSGEAVIGANGSPTFLRAWTQYFATDARDLDSLTKGIWALIEANVTQGRYSFRDGQYQEGFAPYEDEFIQRSRVWCEDDDEG